MTNYPQGFRPGIQELPPKEKAWCSHGVAGDFYIIGTIQWGWLILGGWDYIEEQHVDNAFELGIARVRRNQHYFQQTTPLIH